MTQRLEHDERHPLDIPMTELATPEGARRPNEQRDLERMRSRYTEAQIAELRGVLCPKD
ncbi:MAG: hypothetical protein OXU81_05815 [Gammaproteobacteria bacterium]|nr:hypothetical protein [Gammaproteobacteria bacterium]